MAGRGMKTLRPRGPSAASYYAPLGRSQMSDQAAVPVWVHRMHADGLRTTGVSSGAPLQAGSQRFIERWNRVASGY